MEFIKQCGNNSLKEYIPFLLCFKGTYLISYIIEPITNFASILVFNHKSDFTNGIGTGIHNTNNPINDRPHDYSNPSVINANKIDDLNCILESNECPISNSQFLEGTGMKLKESCIFMSFPLLGFFIKTISLSLFVQVLHLILYKFRHHKPIYKVLEYLTPVLLTINRFESLSNITNISYSIMSLNLFGLNRQSTFNLLDLSIILIFKIMLHFFSFRRKLFFKFRLTHYLLLFTTAQIYAVYAEIPLWFKNTIEWFTMVHGKRKFCVLILTFIYSVCLGIVYHFSLIKSKRKDRLMKKNDRISEPLHLDYIINYDRNIY